MRKKQTQSSRRLSSTAGSSRLPWQAKSPWWSRSELTQVRATKKQTTTPRAAKVVLQWYDALLKPSWTRHSARRWSLARSRSRTRASTKRGRPTAAWLSALAWSTRCDGLLIARRPERKIEAISYAADREAVGAVPAQPACRASIPAACDLESSAAKDAGRTSLEPKPLGTSQPGLLDSRRRERCPHARHEPGSTRCSLLRLHGYTPVNPRWTPGPLRAAAVNDVNLVAVADFRRRQPDAGDGRVRRLRTGSTCRPFAATSSMPSLRSPQGPARHGSAAFVAQARTCTRASRSYSTASHTVTAEPVRARPPLRAPRRGSGSPTRAGS